MLPLSDGLRARHFPYVNVLLILINFAVWLVYELPHLQSSVTHASFYPCSVENSCHAPLPWGLSWLTSMFLHGSWDHILGNMLFLAVFGKNVEDAFGHVADGSVPNLGASGAIAAVLGAYFVLYPGSRVFGLIGIFPITVSAWFFLGFWFLYQLFEANFGLFGAGGDGGVAFFAHVGGFTFGYLVARVLTSQGRIEPQSMPSTRPALA
jgi:membrane associated rhomboid family serine protease